eukprot:2439676-Prymnesium_polylepis.1
MVGRAERAASRCLTHTHHHLNPLKSRLHPPWLALPVAGAPNLRHQKDSKSQYVYPFLGKVPI